jgi:hypothetical protein
MSRHSLIAAAALLGLQPITADSLWWHVARGREAIGFNLLPSASLLRADVAAESDWLSGVPMALAFDLAGLHGLMLLQLLLSVAIAVSLICAARITVTDLKAWLLLPALAVLCDRSLPVPSTLTILAIPIVWSAARDAVREPTFTQLLRLAGYCAVAVNLAPCIFWLFIAVAMAGILRDDTRSEPVSYSGLSRSLATVTVAVCVNPRGAFAVQDTFVLAFPQLSISNAYLTGTRFDVLTFSEEPFVVSLFLILSVLVAIVLLWQRAGVAAWSFFVTLQFCVWSCIGNLLPVTVLLVLLGTVSSTNRAVTEPQKQSTSWNFTSLGFTLTSVLLTAVCVLGIADGGRRLGWGVAPHLDYRPLQRDLEGLEVEGTVHTDDVLGAGAVALLELPNLKVHDTPERAMLGGRWVSRWHLWDDISHQRRNPYERDNGTTGGWWSSLRDDDVKLLVIDSRHHQTVRALEETSWRMLSLDSSVIPYGFSGEPEMVTPILNCWDARWLVDYGPWQYDFPGASVDWGRTDLVDVIGGKPLTDECRRLAGVFETLELYHASNKVLTAALSVHPSAVVQGQLQESVRHLANAERTLASRASRWNTWLGAHPGDQKTAANRSLMETIGFPPRRTLGVSQLEFEPLAVNDAWQDARSFYLEGHLDQAAKSLDSDDPATAFGRAQLQIILGQTDAAIDTLQSLNESKIDPVLSVLVAHELKSAQRN